MYVLPDYSSIASVSINAVSVSGTVTATNTVVCYGDITTITLTGYTGTVQWQQSADGITGWTNVTGGSGGTTATYTTPNLTSAIYYRAEVISGVCASVNSTTVYITIPHLTIHYVTITGTDIPCNGTVINPWLTIQYAINHSLPGDTIQVDAGTYNVSSSQILVDKKLLIRAKPGLLSKPKIATSYTSYSYCAVAIAADNVILDGFEIDGSATFNGTFPTNPIGASTVAPQSIYLVGDYGYGNNGWTVKNCYIHHCREGIRISANGNNNVTIQNNNIGYTVKACIDAGQGSLGVCYGLTVTGNWLHSELPNPQGGKPQGVYLGCGNVSSSSSVTISYNYCSACRTFVDLFIYNANAPSPAYYVNINHNTVDWNITQLPSPVQDISDGMLWAIAFWASGNTYTYEGSNFIVKDNIFSRFKYYAIEANGASFNGQVQLSNNIFSQYYLCDAFFPDQTLQHIHLIFNDLMNGLQQEELWVRILISEMYLHLVIIFLQIHYIKPQEQLQALIIRLACVLRLLMQQLTVQI